MVRHYHHQYHLSYLTSFKKHFSLTGIILVILTVVILFSFRFLAPSKPLFNLSQVSVGDLLLATGMTFFRLFIAYVIALVIAVPLGLLSTFSEKLERVLLPIFDILQSIPVLAFFPIVVLVFIKSGFLEGSAIFILVVTMIWSLVFSIVGGVKTIPADVAAAAEVFGARGFKKLWHVTLPAIFPYLLTGSLLSWAAGWNIIIVAEALHNYIPGSSPANDLFGLGSLLVDASYQANTAVFISGLIIMIVTIGLLNFFVWQKLLHEAEKFKFD